MPDISRNDAEQRKRFEAFLDMGSLVKGGRVAVNWLPDGRFWYVVDAPHNVSIKRFDPRSGKVDDMFDVARVRDALSALLGRPLPYAGLPFASFTDAGDAILFQFEGTTYRLNREDHAIAAEPAPNLMEQLFGRTPQQFAGPRQFFRPSYHAEVLAVPEMPSPDGKMLIGLKDHNLALHYSGDGRTEMLTDDGERYCGWDVESLRIGHAAGGSLVHRTVNPWSPDSLRLFATKFDQRQVPVQTRTHLLKRYDEVEEVRVARTGDPIPVVEPYLVDVLQRKAIRIDVPTEDRMLLFLGWTPDARRLYFMLFSRDAHEAALYEADGVTGAARLIHHERGDSYIRIQHQIVWGRPGCTLLPDRGGFLWESEADGWNHLYYYDMDGGLQRRLTDGDWPVLDVLGVDAQGGHVYFTAHHDPARPYDVHFCRVPLDGGAVERLTPEAGVHEIQLAPDFGSFVATRSLPDMAPQSEVRRSDGTLLHRFDPADISGLEKLGWTPPEQFSVKAADGETDIWGVVFKPANFDPDVRYPVIEWIYGGPQIVNTPHYFYAPAGSPIYAVNPALTQLGYVVVVLDARGTPERSKAFQQTSYREWRRHVGNDHAAALKALAAERPWMDIGRVGIWGHSWGGYHTVACMLDHPDVYRAGVASAPGFEPYDYFIYEPYFGGPPGPDNAAAYEDASLFADAPGLRGDLMIATGSSDMCPWQNANKMTDALIRARIDHEFVLLPDEIHGYGAKQESYFIDKLVRHFDRYLKNQG
ncbi:DPP IV N-terminal domain-containing protein [Sphingopyxis sp. J-6]|uniref:S9 family peptidase n=1 Tax=Sphingopyxis sp. J-6 TaxID=3122054 RepID=UPI0039844FB8